MFFDIQGTKRGSCKSCSCSGFIGEIFCNCGHKAIYHKNLNNNNNNKRNNNKWNTHPKKVFEELELTKGCQNFDCTNSVNPDVDFCSEVCVINFTYNKCENPSCYKKKNINFNYCSRRCGKDHQCERDGCTNLKNDGFDFCSKTCGIQHKKSKYNNYGFQKMHYSQGNYNPHVNNSQGNYNPHVNNSQTCKVSYCKNSPQNGYKFCPIHCNICGTKGCHNQKNNPNHYHCSHHYNNNNNNNSNNSLGGLVKHYISP